LWESRARIASSTPSLAHIVCPKRSGTTAASVSGNNNAAGRRGIHGVYQNATERIIAANAAAAAGTHASRHSQGWLAT
jgi:hypothetical protein